MTLIKFKNSNERLPVVPAFLGDFFNDFMNTELQASGVFKSIPAVNITESSEKYLVELASPGMKKEDFKIEVEKNLLTIRAEKNEVKSEDTNRVTRREFAYNSFSRSFTLPEHVNPEAISAEYESGILKITLPKKEEVKQKPVREITVS